MRFPFLTASLACRRRGLDRIWRWGQCIFLLASLLVVQPTSLAGETCAQNSLSYLEELLNEARKRLLIIEYSDARGLLDESQSCLSRLDGVAPPELLGRLFQDLGVARLQLGDERGALEAFRRASVIAPTVRWEPRLGSKAMVPFLTIKEDVLLSPRRKLQLPVTVPGARVALDGVMLDASRTRELFPGTHLLQVQEEDGAPWLGQLMDVPAEGPVPPLPSVVVGRIFRSNTLLALNQSVQLERQLSPGPPAWVRKATFGGAVGSLVLGGAALSVALISRQAVLEQSYETFEEGEQLRQRSNLSLGAGLGLTAAGLALSGASITLHFGFPTDAERTPP